jgi:sulfur-oxidizing protein SoxY
MNKRLMLWGMMASLLIVSAQANAEAVDKYWQSMQSAYFPNATIEESAAIKITAPLRAENGAQVPFAFSIDYPMTADRYVKAVYVIADANPVPLVAVYHFTPNSGKAEVSTRIRLEIDSYVHVVAETSDGKFLMSKAPIRAAGGCGGTIGGDEQIARQSAGKMKLSVKPANETLKEAHLLIKHPMNTGLQRDLVSQGFRPAFFINKVVAKFNDQVVFDADTYIGVSEDPNIQFPFKADQPGKLTVVIKDNEGKEFSTSSDVRVN